MRVYFEKPRTTVGWKGLINDPRLDSSFRINEGIRLARGLLLEICELGLPCATEFLDTITPQYTADLISWVQWAAFAVADGVQFCVHTALRAPDQTSARPFLTPNWKPHDVP